MRKTLVGIAIGAVATILAVFLWPGGSSGRSAHPARHVAASGNPNLVGIKVHGKWTIDVRKPDGRLLARRHFENALEGGASAALAGYLARANTVGPWLVALGTDSGSGGPCPGGPCFVVEPGEDVGESAEDTIHTLTVSVHGDALRLEGSLTAAVTDQINQVNTLSHWCAGTVAPSSCTGFVDGATFTGRTLDAPIAVEAGQQVLVKVDISFS
jgi:hypothetical protein